MTDTLISLGKSPNVGAVLIVSLGCEGTDHERMYRELKATGKPVEIIHIQELGGVSKAIRVGTDIARRLVIQIYNPGAARRDAGLAEQGWKADYNIEDLSEIPPIIAKENAKC